MDKLWSFYENVIKDNGAIVLTAQTPFDKVLGASNLKLLRYEWIWEKNKATGHLNANRSPMKAHENILVFYKRLPNYNPQMGKGVAYSNKHKPGDSGECYGKVSYSERNNVRTRYPRSVLEFDVDVKAEFHPTQKPVALFEYLIRTYTNEGEVVLDNCMGSFTTAIACDNLKRKWIGIEKEEKYCKIGQERINQNREKLGMPLIPAPFSDVGKGN